MFVEKEFTSENTILRGRWYHAQDRSDAPCIIMCHGGAVRRMRTRIGLLAQPEPMRSIVGATQQEQRFD